MRPNRDPPTESSAIPGVPAGRERTRRLLALAVVGSLPWTVIVGRSGLELVFLWGLANPATFHFVGLWDYLLVLTSGLPDRLLAWPTSTGMYLGAVVTELVDAPGRKDGRVSGRGDVRVTAGLLGLAGLAHLSFVVGVTRRGTSSSSVLPLGPALVGIVLWWFYWPALRRRAARES